MGQSNVDRVGTANAHWGVCGFTSAFQALYKENVGKVPLLHGSGIPTKVLAEIKTYLMTLKGEGKLGLLQEIETFTKTFPKTQKGTDFSTFSIDKYIALINKAVEVKKSDEDLLWNEELHSIGMPPRAIVDYLDRMWQKPATLSLFDTNTDGIIGVKRDQRVMYNGLCHYMYRRNQKIHSWGKTYNTVQEANPNYTVICTITFQ